MNARGMPAISSAVSIGVAVVSAVGSFAGPAITVVPTRSNELAFHRDHPAGDFMVEFGSALTLELGPTASSSGLASNRPGFAAKMGVGEGDLMNVLLSLHKLSDGWHGENSLAPTDEAVQELIDARASIAPDARISPAADGSIVIEWDSGDSEFLVSIEHDNTIIFVEEDAVGSLKSEREEPYSSDSLRRALSAGHAAA